ncbi:MAG: hypothetical protein ACD_56C00059G0002 [uncultured bacterium]|nr:MAG: hypothetical protein ACD_56C00059G0002 [uncultured bacterium]
MKEKNKKAFTLIELLIVIAIIGVLASTVLINTNGARKRAKDAKRIIEVSQIQSALEMYYAQYGRYPDSDMAGCGNWDVGNIDSPFIPLLESFLGKPLPRDMTKSGNCDGYFYYRYNEWNSTHYGCSGTPFYVLGATLDGSSHGVNVTSDSQSPGWSCANRDWQQEMGWVTGKYE